MVETYMWLLITAILFLTTSAAVEDDVTNRGKQLIQQLDDVRHNLKSVTESLEKLSDVIEEECTWGGGMSDEMCSTVDIDEIQRSFQVIHDRNSPGKRSVPSMDPSLRQFLQDLLRKKEMIQRLKHILTYADNAVHEERKKSCQLNLGFHCQTQEYSAIADMFNFLGSGRSPGKRRRRSIQQILKTKETL
ncbi:uncharacterized protein LOC143082477 [Mytilus galloprovincialis]|uniref:Uncharacterized protein n=1 Tax=Mytilus galloprovincialis TaxID=29158 RepID=A0A8B6FME5_MYTGA|nr:Hypothetical predicted protein [Mytilus galloprovincialis]